MKGIATALPVAADPTPVISFAEETCFTVNEQLRENRSPVVFRLYSIGKLCGHKIHTEFVSDYGLYYDMDDGDLIQTLLEVAPGVPWRSMVYWKRGDQSKIEIISPSNDRTVAVVQTRRYMGKAVSADAVDAGEYGQNVMSWRAVLAQRELRLAEAGLGHAEA